MLRYAFPVNQSSEVSITTAETSRKHDAVFGKRVATLVRRNISLLSRSNILSVRNRFQCFLGILKTTIPSGNAASAQATSSGADFL